MKKFNKWKFLLKKGKIATCGKKMKMSKVNKQILEQLQKKIQ